MSASDQTLLHNCSVFDGVADRPITRAAVLIRSGRIVEIGPEAEVRARATAGHRAIDLGGGYVMAGLLNMHTHFSLSLPGPGGDEVSRMSAHQLALYMASGARRTLNAGVTTVRCVAEKDHAEFAIRAAI